MERLHPRAVLPPDYILPYCPKDHGVGIVHLGVGAFHKAHQAFYTDQALAMQGGNWRILGVSLRSPAAKAQLGPQGGLYSLMERDGCGCRLQVIGALAGVLVAPEDPGAVLAAMADENCKIVSITVTEKAYGFRRETGGCDLSHPAIAHDLKNPHMPCGVLGFLSRALALRHMAGYAPFTILCCDNLPHNGAMLRRTLIDFTARINEKLADYIAWHVAFPSTMVDRITPVSTDQTCKEAAGILGYEDQAAVETESFHQWVIEDHFPTGRPAWELAGALFVQDVTPYEVMKLRLLNGSHSLLAYTGFHLGLKYVRDVMADPDLSVLVARYMQAAAQTLPPLAGMDVDAYQAGLLARFSNPSIAHETWQIAMDGTEKLPQRIFAAAIDAKEKGQSLRPFSFATAAWMRHATCYASDCPPYSLRDPRANDISARLVSVMDARKIVAALMQLPDFMPQNLVNDPIWCKSLCDILGVMMTQGMRAAIKADLSPESSPGNPESPLDV